MSHVQPRAEKPHDILPDIQMKEDLFPTTVVGSMPRPQYVRDLIDSQVEEGGSSGDFRRMMDSAIPYVAQMQELAGIDIISDGEWRRKSYIGVIADICSGFDLSIKEVLGQRQTWHVVTSEIEVANPGLLAREAGFLKQHTGRDVKVAIPSPYLIGERMWDPELSKAAYPTRRDFTEALRARASARAQSPPRRRGSGGAN